MEIFMDNVAKEMEHLHKLAVANQGKRFQKLWDYVVTETWLSQAWEEIRRNKGSRTPGIDKMTAEDIDLPRIHRLCERLRKGEYRPTAVRRTYIPKSNGKLRPLGIPSLEDRIVQQGLRMVLEPIFEADFLPSSHGFRQGHSPHTALRDVARMYPRVSWVIEGDIVGCFDNIPHNGLLKAVARRIADGKVLGLVSAFLKAGYMENWQYHQTYSGTPQGGILTPLTKWYSPGSTLKKKKGQTSDQCGAHYHSIGGLVHAKTSGLGPTVSQPGLFSLSADQPWQRERHCDLSDPEREATYLPVWCL